ncbi:MAG: TrmH family RNA methyltransferase [Candidatus Saccharimonadales bacterium]
MGQEILILDNIRSAYNVGSIIRSSAAFGITQIYCVGITPYPAIDNDPRLPHVVKQADKRIAKTALGAQAHISFKHSDSIEPVIKQLKSDGMSIYALEQHPEARDLKTFKPKQPFALILGTEVDGISNQILSLCDEIIEIKHSENKESLNVASAAAIALYSLSEAK